MLSILQGYDIDIQHIPGKRNPADSLSRQSVNDALKRKSSVHDANAAYVQQLRVPQNGSDEEIQAALSELFQRRSENSAVQGKSVLKISVNSESQKTEHMLEQISPGPSSPQSKISSVNQDQDPEIKSKLSVLRSGIIIDSSLKK